MPATKHGGAGCGRGGKPDKIPRAKRRAYAKGLSRKREPFALKKIYRKDPAPAANSLRRALHFLKKFNRKNHPRSEAGASNGGRTVRARREKEKNRAAGDKNRLQRRFPEKSARKERTDPPKGKEASKTTEKQEGKNDRKKICKEEKKENGQKGKNPQKDFLHKQRASCALYIMKEKGSNGRYAAIFYYNFVTKYIIFFYKLRIY